MGVANCHNCGDTFVIESENKSDNKRKEYKIPDVKQLPISDRTRNFFKARGIEDRTIEYFKITDSVEWMYEKEADPIKGTPFYPKGNTTCINFPFYEDGKLINIKFRASGKRFKLVTGGKLIFFNQDAIKNYDECYIQEGELDTMSAYQCNFFNCVSVPNGASKGNQRLEYLDNTFHLFTNMKKIFLATDADEAGYALRDEFIRRFGREICWVIDYPDGCKDTNEVLLKYGPEGVKKMYSEARQLPIEGIVDEDELELEVTDIYENGYPQGLKIGYRQFDEHISFIGGQVTLWTGIPGSGKSEFIDQVMVRLSARHGWRHGIFAPENEPRFQASALISKFVGGEMIGKGKINEMKKDRGLQFVKDHFFFMKADEIDVTLDGILALARELVLRKGINSLLIDPYNYIETKIPPGQTETLYISDLMSKLVRFAKMFDIHVNLVAHPTKIQKDKNTDKYKIATLYDISGSANFYNKTFNGISIYRDYEAKIVTAHIQKVKFKWIGHVGSVDFTYDFPTGRYAEVGYHFENDLDRFLNQQTQEIIPFGTPQIREPGVVTDIMKLPINSAFDYTTRDDAPF